ncbi:MAG: hypothetical protein VX223_00735 [Myxococcota bacterium]|nr:hypothetical protein [Myxococcota bacterium]
MHNEKETVFYMRCLLCFLAILVLAPGCQKTHCEQLLQVACTHVEDEDDGLEKCEHLRRQAESVDDELCAQTLEILKDSGKLTAEQNR